jgi:spore germination cell wall hydrolase CwlJ-like protein
MQYSAFNGNVALKAAATSLHLEPAQRNEIDKASWQQSLQVARLVLEKVITDPTKGSISYLAPKVMKIKGYRTPRWAKMFTHTVEIGNHKFYKPVDKVVARL